MGLSVCHEMPAVRYYLEMLRFVLAFATLAGLAAQAQSSTDTLKQVLTKKLLSLKPDGATERNVLYREVRADAGNVFQVTALIRGYPRNHYYGETCVGHLDRVRFTLARDEFGGFDVQGAMTPPLDTRQCKPNLSAGVSSIPLSSLSGAAAPSGNPTAAAPAPLEAVSTANVVAGSYQCWANGQARMLLNFQIRSAGQYVGSDGKLGSFRYQPGTGRISFQGGALDGVMPAGFQSIYYAPRGVPTVSFQGPSGSEAAFCQKVR